MSMPCRAASAINASGSAPSRRRVRAHSNAERVPLRQCATTGAGFSRRAAAKAPASRKKSGGELRRAVYQVAGADPEPLKAAQGEAGRLQILCTQRSLRQQLGVAPMHLAQAVAQFDALVGKANVDRAAVVQ